MEKLILVEYDPTWPTQFAALAKVLQSALEGLARTIHHIGSTSIPGMIAKPIIDIDVELLPDAPLEAATARLTVLRYVFQGDLGIKDRYAYKRTSGTVPYTPERRTWLEHHLYVCPHNSRELARHLLFRDRLRESAQLRKSYMDIKREALSRSGEVRQIYVD